MIDVTMKERGIVQDILAEHLPEARIWVFGSRATGRTRRGSDLDLAVDARRALTLHEMARLKDAFDEAPLAFGVDVVDLHSVSDAFKRIIERDAIAWTASGVAA